ncbi:MAG: hypothetical protein JW891_02050 [Candidatus Lokiarchaeota archaeon]|nr:hypothetical protein [Candidatus Lokiarchaeota archaeon]
MVIGGVSNSGKSKFLNRTTLIEEEIGVSFQSLECLVNDGDSYKFIFWDLNAKKIFRFMYPQFCRGAKAGFLFFDLSNPNTLIELSFWIEIFKKSAKNIPLILIGTLPENGEIQVKDEEISHFISQNGLNDRFFFLPNEEHRRKEKERIFKHLIQLLNQDSEIKQFEIISPLEDPKFIDFYHLFSNCPTCNAKNHENYLAKFFYSKDAESVKIKELLLELIEKAQDLPFFAYDHLKIGIPCCRCFKKYC